MGRRELTTQRERGLTLRHEEDVVPAIVHLQLLPFVIFLVAPDDLHRGCSWFHQIGAVAALPLQCLFQVRQ